MVDFGAVAAFKIDVPEADRDGNYILKQWIV